MSIIICTYNGKHRLEKTLLHAIKQTCAFPFEILIVDNASTDGTSDWVMEFVKQHDYFSLIRMVEEKEPGLSSARNRGVRESRFSLVLFCDDDNWLASDYLAIGSKYFLKYPDLGALGGEGIPVFESAKPDWFDQYSHSFAVGDLKMKSGILPKGSAVYGAACFFRKSAITELYTKDWSSLLTDRKGESLSSGGDVELCYAIQLLGYQIGFEKSLKFQHFLEDRRLKWGYYLNLKKGISKSFPILSAYKLDDFQSLSDFRKNLLSQFILTVKGVLKTALLPKNSYQREVDYIVVRAKFWAFLRNYQSAIDGYKRNQRIFGS